MRHPLARLKHPKRLVFLKEIDSYIAIKTDLPTNRIPPHATVCEFKTDSDGPILQGVNETSKSCIVTMGTYRYK